MRYQRVNTQYTGPLIQVIIYWSYFKTISVNPKTCNAGEVENVLFEAGKHFHIRL